jgi:predicted GTPase
LYTACRLKDDDDDAAEVGVTETTTAPTEYKHPDNPMISFLDLPGIGTPKFPDLRTYCEKVSFEDYDTFLIFTEGRFRQVDLDLAKKVKAIGKSFFLVRTHIDEACNGRSINEPEILKVIGENCMKNVKALISSEEEIFLISNYHKDKWDFDRLIAAISDVLPVRQRECLTLSLTNVTRECLKRKAKILRGKESLRSRVILNYMFSFYSPYSLQFLRGFYMAQSSKQAALTSEIVGSILSVDESPCVEE